MNELTQFNGIFNGKKFYAKRLLLDEYEDMSRKLLVAIIENNENNKMTFKQKKIKIIEQLLILKGGEHLGVIEEQTKRQALKYGNGEAA